MWARIGAIITFVGGLVYWFVRGTIESWFFDQVIQKSKPSVLSINIVEYGPPTLFAVVCISLILWDIWDRRKVRGNISNKDKTSIAHPLLNSSSPEPLPGISLHMAIRINNVLGNRKKYLFDFGQITGPRLSVYISPDNIFTCAFLDNKGEPHPIHIPLGGTNGIPMARFFYLACELGIDNNSTLLRVIVDGNVYGSTRLPYRIDISSIDIPNGVMGADLEGKNGNSFDLQEFAVYSILLSDEDIVDALKYFNSNFPPTKYVAFNGKQMLRAGEYGARKK